MKIKKILALITIILLPIIIIVIISFNWNNKNKIPNNYIAVFHGGSGEHTYSTYIYKIDNGQANYGFKYINTVNDTIPWSTSNTVIKTTEKGKVEWTDEIFKIAEKHGAYSYVLLPNNSKPYTINEFITMFMMD